MAEQHTDRRERLFERHVDVVYAYVAFRLGGRSEDVADITQEVFLAAFRGRQEDIINERQWLLGIARNKVVDFLRRRSRDRAISGLDQVVMNLPDAVASGLADGTDARAVSAVLNELSPRYAELLEMKYIDGHSVRAIAEAFGETEKAIESALTRARSAFRAKWQDMTEPSERVTP